MNTATIAEASHREHGHEHDHAPAGIARWLTSTNHKDIGTLYLWFSLFMFFFAGALAMLIRAELFQPGLQLFQPAVFNQLTTMHGLIMIFGAIMPSLVGFANWQVPLMGGVFDKVFTSPETLTVQKLGVLYDAHPALALPDWASYTTLTIETDIGSIVFAGSASQYEDFLFPANGDYKAKLTVWRLPQDYLATQFEGGTTGAIRKNLGVEHPAKPTGWYSYSFRFTLQASAEVDLSTERLEQGGVGGGAQKLVVNVDS